MSMNRWLRVITAVLLVLSVGTLGLSHAPPAAADVGLRLELFPTDPNSAILAGRIYEVDPGIAFVTVTVILPDGTSLSLNVDGSTDWTFSFGELPTDGWIGLAVTEHPVPLPVLVGEQWNFVYMYGYYFANPLPDVAWVSFPGYISPVGYGWGYYPFGAYVWAQYLEVEYALPFFWTYPPVVQTTTYTYYGVAGLQQTYVVASRPPTVFGTLYQPRYLQVAPPPVVYSTVAPVTPVAYTAAVAAAPPAETTAAAQVVSDQTADNQPLVPKSVVASSPRPAEQAISPTPAPAASPTAAPAATGTVQATPAASPTAASTAEATPAPKTTTTPASTPAATPTPTAAQPTPTNAGPPATATPTTEPTATATPGTR